MAKKPLMRGFRLWHYVNGRRIAGPNPNMTGDCNLLTGDCSGMTGNCTGLHGVCTGLTGECTGLWGGCTGLSGNLDDIPMRDRPCGIHDWVEGE